MYNLKAIQVFVVVAETCSFRKAAEILHRSQSAVSTQIKLLEDQIGVSLFHRTTRRVQLTAEGVKLLVHAQRAITSLEAGMRQIREAANIQGGYITMGCVPSIASTVLPRVLAEFQAKRAGIKLELRELASEQLLEAITRQEISFGIGPRVDDLGDFDFAPISNEPIYALIPRSHWLPGREFDQSGRAGPAAARARLRRRRRCATCSTARWQSRDLAITNAFEVIQVQTMLAFAQVGLGTAILPRIMIPDPLDAELQALPIVEPIAAAYALRDHAEGQCAVTGRAGTDEADRHPLPRRSPTSPPERPALRPYSQPRRVHMPLAVCAHRRSGTRDSPAPPRLRRYRGTRSARRRTA